MKNNKRIFLNIVTLGFYSVVFRYVNYLAPKKIIKKLDLLDDKNTKDIKKLLSKAHKIYRSRLQCFYFTGLCKQLKKYISHNDLLNKKVQKHISDNIQKLQVKDKKELTEYYENALLPLIKQLIDNSLLELSIDRKHKEIKQHISILSKVRKEEALEYYEKSLLSEIKQHIIEKFQELLVLTIHNDFLRQCGILHNAYKTEALDTYYKKLSERIEEYINSNNKGNALLQKDIHENAIMYINRLEKLYKNLVLEYYLERLSERVIEVVLANKDNLLNEKLRKQLEGYLKRLSGKHLEKARYMYTKYLTICQIKHFIYNLNFYEADRLYKNNVSIIEDELSEDYYKKFKQPYIQKYFKEVYEIDLDNDQAATLTEMEQNLLITARAGSGKSRCIVCRTIYAIEQERYDPDQVMVLAFNSKAAEEIRQRIIGEVGYAKINRKNIRTFHSLAWGIVNPLQEVLHDDPDKATEQHLTKFIQNIYEKNKNTKDDFLNKIYSFLRADSGIENELEWDFDSKEEKYLYLKNKKHVTLQGEAVKSSGEKYIADFLFEHNIDYYYEKTLTQAKADGFLYRPDFTIDVDDKTFVLEHWGIDEHDKTKSVPAYWSETWDEYHDTMIRKRNLFDWYNRKQQKKGQPGIIFLETSIVDLKNGRNAFEMHLKKLLETKGIPCVKQDVATLVNKVQLNQSSKVIKRIMNFIQAAKKNKMSPEDILNKARNVKLSDRTKKFLILATYIYKKYDEELIKQDKTDFDNIMLEAIQKIKDNKGNCPIKVRGKEFLNIKDLKILLIDEFQDFAPLFYDLVDTIRKYNPDMKLYCVGDNWQAINGFAGSDVKYFNNFADYFNDSAKTYLSMNYRSSKAVVEAGNVIMQKTGEPPAICHDVKNVGKIIATNVTKLSFYLPDDKEYIYDAKNDTPVYFGINHRIFKYCYDIIRKNPMKSYFIIDRTSIIVNTVKLEDFQDALIKKLRKDGVKNPNVKVNTIHQFKGAEADVVIILETDEDDFPFIHPDNEFNYIFGRTPQVVLDEERRLFYVAVTRAKEDVYFVHLTKDLSCWVKKLVEKEQKENYDKYMV